MLHTVAHVISYSTNGRSARQARKDTNLQEHDNGTFYRYTRLMPTICWMRTRKNALRLAPLNCWRTLCRPSQVERTVVPLRRKNGRSQSWTNHFRSPLIRLRSRGTCKVKPAVCSSEPVDSLIRLKLCCDFSIYVVLGVEPSRFVAAGMSPSNFQILNLRTNQTNGTGAMALNTIPPAMNSAQPGYGCCSVFAFSLTYTK